MVLMTKKSKWAYYSINDQFIKENDHLIAYLKNNFSEDKDFVRDMKILISLEEDQALCSDSNIVKFV
ncbi:hypothetical protein JCM21714_1271 [Gracilibacillus boraciitolerans JCM 21714]|uniref:Arsenical resistance operon repressor n=2 Tax=Gracilibacillus boraciitolerans TaxID=307521 RepID=W4VHI5_9BACI|nr:hypothetical protein JCM21714_1271 [Gracilibacillus boraciitolerans JCM 21714]